MHFWSQMLTLRWDLRFFPTIHLPVQKDPPQFIESGDCLLDPLMSTPSYINSNIRCVLFVMLSFLCLRESNVKSMCMWIFLSLNNLAKPFIATFRHFYSEDLSPMIKYPHSFNTDLYLTICCLPFLWYYLLWSVWWLLSIHPSKVSTFHWLPLYLTPGPFSVSLDTCFQYLSWVHNVDMPMLVPS